MNRPERLQRGGPDHGHDVDSATTARAACAKTSATCEFWSTAEEARWKAAGSPVPPPLNPEYRQRYKTAFRKARSSRTPTSSTQT